MPITTRPATPEDVPDLYAVMASAFAGSALDARVFPASDPRTVPDQIANIARNIAAVTVAQDEDGVIQGWASWARRDADHPPATVKAEDFPPTGDRAFGVRFFQNNADRSRAAARGEAHWFLSIMVVRPEAQRKGVGAALMSDGVRRIDEEGGLIAGVNASPAGKGLYERYGFRTVEESAFEGGIHSFHMRRESLGRIDE